MKSFGLDLGDDAQRYLKRAHVSTEGNFRSTVDWPATFGALTYSEEQRVQCLEYEEIDLDDIGLACRSLCRINRCRALLAEVTTWCAEASTDVPRRGVKKLEQLHAHAQALLERAMAIDVRFQNHGDGCLFVAAFFHVFDLTPCQELAVRTRRQLWDGVVAMVTTLVERLEGQYRIACGSQHLRAAMVPAAALMHGQGESPSIVKMLVDLAGREVSVAHPRDVVCPLQAAEALQERVAVVFDAASAGDWSREVGPQALVDETPP